MSQRTQVAGETVFRMHTVPANITKSEQVLVTVFGTETARRDPKGRRADTGQFHPFNRWKKPPGSWEPERISQRPESIKKPSDGLWPLS